MKVQRYDRMLITGSMLKKDSAGFLTVTAPITQPGVFPYQRADGNVEYEAKLPEDVFRDLAIHSSRAKVTQSPGFGQGYFDSFFCNF